MYCACASPETRNPILTPDFLVTGFFRCGGCVCGGGLSSRLCSYLYTVFLFSSPYWVACHMIPFLRMTTKRIHATDGTTAKRQALLGAIDRRYGIRIPMDNRPSDVLLKLAMSLQRARAAEFSPPPKVVDLADSGGSGWSETHRDYAVLLRTAWELWGENARRDPTPAVFRALCSGTAIFLRTRICRISGREWEACLGGFECAFSYRGTIPPDR